MTRFEFHFVCEELNLEQETLQRWIESRLIQPSDPSGPFFDEEDLSRLRLLSDMKQLYGTNDESLEVLLHLIDQIHHLTAEIKKLKS